MKRRWILACILALASCQGRKLEAQRVHPKPPGDEELLAAAIERVKAAPNFENYTDLGLAYSRLKKPAAALQAFLHSAELEPKSAVAANNLCSQYLELKMLKQAEDRCRFAVRADPKLSIAANNLKWVEETRAQIESRIRDLASRLPGLKDAERTSALIDLGYAHYQLEDYPAAVASWNKVGRKDPHYAVVLNNLASVNIVERKFELAAKQLEEAARLDPASPLIANNRLWLKEASEKVSK